MICWKKGYVVFWIGTLFLSVRAAVCAGEAAFSEDGSTVYFENTTAKTDAPLCMFDVKTGKIAEATFKFTEPNETFEGICRYTDKCFLIVSERHLWKWDPISNKSSLVESAPEGVKFNDAAYSARSGRVVIADFTSDSGSNRACYNFLMLEKGASSMVSVRAWRLHYMMAPQFLDDDTLVFGCDGDLWHGRIQNEPPDGDSPSKEGPLFLAAYRYAPLGTPENYMGSPSATGVKALAISKGMVYAQVSRLAGDGWGALVRLPLPPPNKDDFDRHDDFVERRKIYLDALMRVEVLDQESDWPVQLCTSADGNLVHFVGSIKGPLMQRRHYMIDNNGKAKQVGP